MNEIEKMSRMICTSLCVSSSYCNDCDNCGNGCEVSKTIALDLINAGYGDVKQALEDYATKLHNNIVVYLKRDFDTREEVCKIIDETLKEVCGE